MKRVVFTVKPPGFDSPIEFRTPGVAEWDRFIAKRRTNEMCAGRRELIACCCVSHNPDDILAMLKRFPALVQRLADQLEEEAGANEFGNVSEDGSEATVVTPDGQEITIRRPTLAEWNGINDAELDPLDAMAAFREFITKLCKESPQGAFEKWPAMPAALLNTASIMAGMGIEIELKKE